MIGAMPAVAVRHERRRQEKRKRPSQLYLSGQWLPSSQGSPPTPSPHGHNTHLEPLPELYLCGKISCLHAVVVCLLLGAVVLVVGLVQLAPGATTTDHRLLLLIAGATLLLFGIILAGVRCYVLHCIPLPSESPVAATPIPAPGSNQSSVARDTLDLLVGHENQPETDTLMNAEQQQQQQQHHHPHHHHHGNHKKKRSSQGSHTEEA